MNKAIKIVLMLLFVSSFSFAKESKKYGKEITLTEKTQISKILENPEAFVGKKVLVEGTVVGVCAKRGCWISLAGDKEYESIKVKVNDGEIVFPMEAKGKKALVEGEVYSFVLDGEGCGGDCSKEEHKKGDKKEECKHEKKQKKVYQIKGLGAVIK